MRIAFATAIIGFVGIYILRGWHAASTVSGYIPHAAVTPYSLSVIPLFIIMGYFAFYAGLTSDIYKTAQKWFGHLPGGLAIATVFGCAGFAACTGSSTASAAVMGRIGIPEMIEHGYDRRLAAGVVAASGTLAALIPPSIILVIYGIITEQSVGMLLIAGFIPGILSALIYGIGIYVRVKLNPDLGKPSPAVPFKQKILALRGTWGMLLIIALILGGIYAGWFTPTEAGGIGAFSAFLMALGLRRLTLTNLREALLETGKTTVMIFTIMAGVLILIYFLALTGVPDAFAQMVIALPFNRYLVLIAILTVYVVLGMFLDGLGMLMLTLPIVFPAVTALGFDPIWFGIIVVKMVEICLVTPPVGLNVYMVRSVAPEIPLEQIFLGIIPFVVMDLLTVALLIIFPEIITFLPSTMQAS
jgi:tripartite ATP-independent transporter DctM subunit